MLLGRFHRYAPRLSPYLSRAMSLQAVISKLQSPVKELVISVTQQATQHTGQSEQDQADVKDWLEKTAAGEFSKEKGFKNLNELLVARTYLVNNYLTAADVAVYGSLHSTISKRDAPAHYSLPALTRYFDYIQSIQPVRAEADKLAPSFGFVKISLEEAPRQERKIEAPRKKEKKPAGGNGEATAQTEQAPAAKSKKEKKDNNPASVALEGEEKEKKKEKKNAVEAGGSSKKESKTKAPTPAAADDGEPVPSMIDLRVGRIIDIKKHPDADSLYVEQIDIGEETGPRTVVSGLVHYIPIENMRDQYLVAVCNLKPANMRGVKSHAMVLCATSPEGKEGGIELVKPPAGSKPGDRVYFEGADYESATPLTQLNPKKKIFETIQPGLTTLESKEAAWINPVTKSVHKICTSAGPCIAPTFIGASLS